MSSSRSSKRFKSRKAKTRGDYTVHYADIGTGTADDPKILWLYIPPRVEDRRKAVHTIIREAAAVTGFAVWYIRSEVHDSTTEGGEPTDDDPHITVFADEKPDQPEDERFDYAGHLYTDPDKDGAPTRFLHPREFKSSFNEHSAPILMWHRESPNDELTWTPKPEYYESFGFKKHELVESEEFGADADYDQNQMEASGPAPKKKGKKRARK